MGALKVDLGLMGIQVNRKVWVSGMGALWEMSIWTTIEAEEREDVRVGVHQTRWGEGQQQHIRDQKALEQKSQPGLRCARELSNTVCPEQSMQWQYTGQDKAPV